MSGLHPTDYDYPSAGQGMIEKISSNCFARSVFKSLVPNLGGQWKKHILENIFLTVTKIQTFDNQTLILDLHDYRQSVLVRNAAKSH